MNHPAAGSGTPHMPGYLQKDRGLRLRMRGGTPEGPVFFSQVTRPAPVPTSMHTAHSARPLKAPPTPGVTGSHAYSLIIPV